MGPRKPTRPMPKIVIYTTPFCPYCLMAKRLLAKKGVAFEEIDVSGN
jgi:glutaredoxin 3